LGYRLQRTEKLLSDFVSYVDAQSDHRITIDLAVAWATMPNCGTSWWAMRLSAVRGFATYLHALDSAAEVPPTSLLPNRHHRAVPYLYTDEDVVGLMEAAQTLGSPLRVLTYRTLIGLLVVTDMRVGEALQLDRADLDCEHGLLTVRAGKFGKSRELPLHVSTIDSLRIYLE
jgi:integrase/recombinase XerD